VVTDISSKECLCLLWEKYGHKDTPVELKRSVSSVLTEYKGDVPLEYYLTIIKSTDNDCKTYGITGLGRFEYNKIKHVLIELLNDEEHLIHHKTLEISFENGFIVDLVNEGFITQDYLNKCSKRIDIFLETIIKYGLYKYIAFALEILKESATEKSLILYVKALVFDNQVERAFQNFKWNYYDEDELKYTHNTDSSTHNRRFQRNIFEFINIFPPSFALQILRELNDKLEEVNCNRCINTFSYKINSLCRNSPSFEFVPFLKELIIDRLEKNNFLEMDNSNILEQYIIALSYLMQNNDESWLVEVCTKYKNIPSESLVRLLAQLSQIAYLETTLKLAKQIGHRYRSFELVLHYCYKICDTYYRKNGILKQVTEEEFFE